MPSDKTVLLDIVLLVVANMHMMANPFLVSKVPVLDRVGSVPSH